MQHYVYCLLICILAFACGDTRQEKLEQKQHQKIQSVTVTKKINLNDPDQGFFYYPRFTPDGTKIILTSSNYRGLSYYDLSTKRIIFLNDMPGAGLDFCFSSDNMAIFFKSDTLQNRRRYYNIFRQDLRSQDIYKLNKQSIQKVRGLARNDKNVLIYWVDNRAIGIDLNSGESVPATTSKPQYSLQGDKFIVLQNEAYNKYTPFPNQNLIWIESIPLSSHILIYVVGHGLYNFNPEDTSSTPIGDFRAARCSPDARLLAYMRDEDDGHRIIGSDIFVATMDDQRTFAVTDTKDEIEMYPEWAPDGQNLVFHTESGVIKLVSLQIN